MATHSSSLAWRIPGTEDPGGLLSMGSCRVRHDGNNLAGAAAHSSSQKMKFLDSIIRKYVSSFSPEYILHCVYFNSVCRNTTQLMLVIKNLAASAGDIRNVGPIPGSGRSPGGGHGNPFQYFCLENPMDRGTWWATVHRVTKSHTELK